MTEEGVPPVAEETSVKPTVDAKYPLCPICREFPYEPMVGTCGHTTCCLTCHERMDSKRCPVCRLEANFNAGRKVSFRPNYDLRSMLQQVFPEEWAKAKAAYEQNKPAAQLEAIRQQRSVLQFSKVYEKPEYIDGLIAAVQAAHAAHDLPEAVALATLKAQFRNYTVMVLPACAEASSALAVRMSAKYHVFFRLGNRYYYLPRIIEDDDYDSDDDRDLIDWVHK